MIVIFKIFFAKSPKRFKISKIFKNLITKFWKLKLVY